MVVEGTLYTLLNRLRKEGKLEYEWEESPKGPPRKYYFITDVGRETLAEMSGAWDEIVMNVTHFRRLAQSTEQVEEQQLLFPNYFQDYEKNNFNQYIGVPVYNR